MKKKFKHLIWILLSIVSTIILLLWFYLHTQNNEIHKQRVLALTSISNEKNTTLDRVLMNYENSVLIVSDLSCETCMQLYRELVNNESQQDFVKWIFIVPTGQKPDITAVNINLFSASYDDLFSYFDLSITPLIIVYRNGSETFRHQGYININKLKLKIKNQYE